MGDKTYIMYYRSRTLAEQQLPLFLSRPSHYSCSHSHPHSLTDMFSNAGNLLVGGGIRHAVSVRATGLPTRSTTFSQAIRSLFIQTENTPNPESIKFVPGRPVLEVDEGGEVGAGFFASKTDKGEVARSPLAKALFEVDGVKSIYLGIGFPNSNQVGRVTLGTHPHPSLWCYYGLLRLW